jgi:creatinine amidohydrolase/Fe(II)-dependent formamide hydrolase-like protein
VLRNWWQLGGVEDLALHQFPIGHGSHATPSEIAVTQAAYPECIKIAVCEPQIASSGPIREAHDFRARHPDGRMGSDPSLATPGHGTTLIEKAAEGLIAEVRKLGVLEANRASAS